jgi:hypothetical protein
MNEDLRLALKPVMAAFRLIGIPFAVGGSLASSAWGMARSTLDADLVADINSHHVIPLYRLLQKDFYLDDQAMRHAVDNRTTFNLIHLKTMLKIDIFVLTHRGYDQQVLARKRMEIVSAIDEKDAVPLTTPEDIILHKLEWFRAGGEISERQWKDVLGVLKVQAEKLDRAYLERWASELKLDDLLSKALHEAELG